MASRDVHPLIFQRSSLVVRLGLSHPLSLKQASLSFRPFYLILLSAIPAPLVHFGAIQTELLREGFGTVLIEPCALLVLPLQNLLLVLAEMAPSHAISLAKWIVMAAVGVGMSRSLVVLNFL